MKKILLGLIFLVLLQSAFAIDVAYVMVNLNNKDNNVLDVFDELGFDVTFIRDDEAASVDFSQYDLVFVQDDLYRHPEDIPITDQDSVVINRRNMDDWNYNVGWASSVTATQPLEVYTYDTAVSEGLSGVYDIYIQGHYDNSGVGIPLYYLHRYDVAPALKQHIVSYPFDLTDPNPQLNGAVFSIPPGTQLLNSDVNNGKTCYFGAVESDYWTPYARELFKQCVGWAAECSDIDEDGFSTDGGGCGPIDCNDNNPDVYPGAEEMCDNLDNDCDLETDEDWPELGDFCSVGLGECYDEGIVVCSQDGLSAECSAVEGEPTEEICDNLDNDCNDLIDDDLTRETSCGVGICSDNTGYETCTEGVWGGDTCDPYEGAEEEILCDDIDQDCNGEDAIGTDNDGDGYTIEDELCGGLDCNDNDPNVHPGADEICNGIDDDCDGIIDGMENLCGEGICEGTTTCVEGVWGDCSSSGEDAGTCASCDSEGNIIADLTQDTGEVVGDCDSNDLPAIEQCDYNPDNIDETFDTHDAVYSQCSGIDECTTTEYDIQSFEHECNTDQCGAECEIDDDCQAYCENDLYYSTGTCDTGGCACSYDEPVDCNAQDGWYDTGNTQWIEDSSCTEKEQKEQEYRDYGCGAEGCSYDVTDTQWVDTQDTRNKENGTSCEDGLFCSVGDTCQEGICTQGAERDCSENDVNVNECLYNPDNVDQTFDSYSFTSTCDEELNECTSVEENWEDDITHTCDIAQCGAFCEDNEDCGSYCEDDIYYYSGECNGGCYCSYDTETCSDSDGWYDTGDKRWIDLDQCNEKQQKKQEYRDYGCGLEGCDYTVTDTQWIDLEIEEPKADGTSCDDGQFCTENDQCTSGICGGAAIDVDDGLFCTDDSCNEDTDSIDHTPVDVDDGLFCTDDSCNEDTDTIDHTAVDVDDQVSCTADSCDEGLDEILHVATDSLCDNGLFCDGAEFCDETLDCQAGTAPDTDDGLFCTDDSCNEDTDTIDHTAVDVDDGLFCTDDSCNEDTDSIDHTPVDVDDGVSCTDDLCDEGLDEVVHTPNDGYCTDGLFCNGIEFCDETLDCQAGTVVDCSGNDVSGIATCLNDPDNIDETYDYRDEFTSECVEEVEGYSCTIGIDTIAHSCDILQCGAECEEDLDCSDTDCDTNDGCYEGVYRDYHDVSNTCDLNSCGCTQNLCLDYDIIFIDNDGDGFSPDGPTNCGPVDCNDNDATIYPGAPEIDDDIDQNCVNDPPYISADDVTVYETELVKVIPVYGDVDDGDPVVTYASPLNGVGEWQTGYDDAGVYPTEVHASDGEFTTDDSLTITVLNVNRPPVAIIDSPINGNVYGDADLIYFDGRSSYDPDGDSLTYHWTSNIDGVIGSLDDFSSSLSIGTHLITLEVSDGDLSDTASVTIEVIDSTPDIEFNYIITATGTQDETIYPDQEFNCVVTGTGTEIIDTQEIVSDGYTAKAQHEGNFNSNICSGLGGNSCAAEGCTWHESSNSVCVGTARQCSELGNAACLEQDGCSLGEAQCTGGTFSCRRVERRVTCNNLNNCEWDAKDDVCRPKQPGKEFSCKNIDKKDQCEATSGKCSWEPASCKGTASACNIFGRLDICEEQRGCSWEEDNSGYCTEPRICSGSNPCDNWLDFEETTRHTACYYPVDNTEGGSCLVWEGSSFTINSPNIPRDVSCKVRFRGEYGGGTGENEDLELTVNGQTQIVNDLGQASGQPKIWIVGEFAERFDFTQGYNEMKWKGLGGSLGLDWYRIYDCVREEGGHREEPRQRTDSCHDTVNKLEGDKYIFDFDAEPQPQEGGYIDPLSITYEVTDDNPDVDTWISGSSVYASTDVEGTNTIPWSDTESGSGVVSAEDGIKLITISGLVAPNGDTFWSVEDDEPEVLTFMGDSGPSEGVNGPYLYATTDLTLNTAPFIGGIPDKHVGEDSGEHLHLVDLHAYAHDNEQSDSELGFSILSQTNSALITCYVDANRYVSCNAPSLNNNGQTTLWVQVTDGEFNDITYFDIIVDPVNDAPVMNPIDDIYVNEGELVKVVPGASDVDNNIGDLIFTFSSPLDTSGEWQTTTGDAGVYPTSISVYDGSLSDIEYFNIYVLTFGLTECNDGIDNDGDGLVDMFDPGCDNPEDDDETDPIPVTQCNDGIDNDGDGFTDYPNDPGCSGELDDDETDPVPTTECSDEIDNDGDGLIDYPDDPGCEAEDDDDETDEITATQCSDGIDNDQDGLIDYPDDPGCVTPLDDDETDGTTITECSDGIDNDLDGLVDLDDPGCSDEDDDDESDGTTQCQDNVDNDQDGLIDYPDDPGCDNPEDDNEGDGNGDCDNDSIPDSKDNCVCTPNRGQGDIDGDGIGNACDDTYDKEIRNVKHDFDISGVRIFDEFSYPGEEVEVYTYVKNKGNADEDNIQVWLQIPELNIIEKAVISELNGNEGKWAYMTFNIPLDAEFGEYVIKLIAENTKDYDVLHRLMWVG